MLEQILQTWAKGGWVMWPLLAVCVMMFTVGLRLWRQLRRMPDRLSRESDWPAWIEQPDRAEPGLREILAYVQTNDPSPRRVHLRFAEVATNILPSIDRQLATLSTLVAAAPLVGLLGTVFGMLVTFQALALGGGGGQITEAMAAGISQALSPPEVGLCIALPGMVLVNLARRRRHEIEAFLARLESLTLQRLQGHRRPDLVRPAPAGAAASLPQLEAAPLSA